MGQKRRQILMQDGHCVLFVQTNTTYYRVKIPILESSLSSPPWMLCLQEEERILNLFQQYNVQRSNDIPDVMRIRIKTRQQILCFHDLMKSIFDKTEIEITSFNNKMPCPNFRPNMLIYFGLASKKEKLLL